MNGSKSGRDKTPNFVPTSFFHPNINQLSHGSESSFRPYKQIIQISTYTLEANRYFRHPLNFKKPIIPQKE